jgi:hypothetical protein
MEMVLADGNGTKYIEILTGLIEMVLVYNHVIPYSILPEWIKN